MCVSVGVNYEIKQQSLPLQLCNTHTRTHTPLRVWEWIPSPPASGGLFQLLGRDVCVIGGHSYGDHLPELLQQLRGQKHAAFPAACSMAAATACRTHSYYQKITHRKKEHTETLRGTEKTAAAVPPGGRLCKETWRFLLFFSASEPFLSIKTLMM